MPLALQTATTTTTEQLNTAIPKTFIYESKSAIFTKPPGFQTCDQGTLEVNTLFADILLANPRPWVCLFQQPRHHCDLMLLQFLLVLHRSAVSVPVFKTLHAQCSACD